MVSDPILIHGDCLTEIPRLADDSIHGVCTDPPYGLVEYSPTEVAKLRAGSGGVWRIPPRWDGCSRRPLPRFTVLSPKQKLDIEQFFRRWASALLPKLRPGAHLMIAGNPILQMHVQSALVAEGYENRGTILRMYHGFRGGDRPKNAEKEFPTVCVTPRGYYEPWMLFRKPISERTVADNLRKWETGGLRMFDGAKPLPDAIPSFKTPEKEREVANHPSLKPQHFLRIVVRSLLPLGRGVLLDPFMGSGSTVAAAMAVGYDAIGIETDEEYYADAKDSVVRLAALYPNMDGSTLESPTNGAYEELSEQLFLLDSAKDKFTG